MTFFAVAPGQPAVYAEARDLFGAVDPRLPPIVIAAPKPDRVWCREAWVAEFCGGKKNAERL